MPDYRISFKVSLIEDLRIPFLKKDYLFERESGGESICWCVCWGGVWCVRGRAKGERERIPSRLLAKCGAWCRT